jgi:hypothetical protein
MKNLGTSFPVSDYIFSALLRLQFGNINDLVGSSQVSVRLSEERLRVTGTGHRGELSLRA